VSGKVNTPLRLKTSPALAFYPQMGGHEALHPHILAEGPGLLLKDILLRGNFGMMFRAYCPLGKGKE
jgi:hypothetical protein